MNSILPLLCLIIPPCACLVVGPITTNVWQFSTHVPFGLTLFGLDLSFLDTIRILESGSSCTDNSGDPRNVVTSVQYDCPNIGTGCSWLRSQPTVNLPTRTTNSSCVQFTTTLSCTGLNSVVSTVTVSQTGSVDITFSNPHFLAVGDFVMFSNAFTCRSGSTCTSTMLDLLVNGETATNGARVGNEITAVTTNTLTVSIPSLASSISVPIIDADLVDPPTWTRTSRQDTAVGFVGTVAKSNLVVCWNKRGVASGYRTQIGTLSIVDPNPFTNVGIYPRGVSPENSRFILTFSTNNAVEYSTPPTSYTQQAALILTWTQPTALSLASVVTPVPNIANEGLSQLACGAFLEELWSSNTRVRFPAPNMCAYNTSEINSTVVRIELTILFSPSNGLSPNSDYKIAFRASIPDPSSLLAPSLDPCCSTGTCGTVTSPPYVRFCQLMRVTYIPDYQSAPYNALQMSFAQLSNDKLIPARFTRLSTHPLIASVAMNMFTTNNLLSSGLIANTLFTFTAGVISPGFYIRILPNPIFIWRLQAACIGTAAVGSVAPTPMSSATPLTICQGIEDVPGTGWYTGILLRIPTTLSTPITGGTNYLFINLVNIPTPSGGTFGARFHVQISDTNDQFPHSVQTSNSYLKSPDALRSVARIAPNQFLQISSFVNQAVIFTMQIVPAISLAVGDTIKITAPAGFECTGMAAPAIPGDLYTNAPTPSGYGLVVAGTYSTLTTDSRSCQVVLSAAIHQGCSYMFKLSIVNRPTPILITNSANVWMVYFARPPTILVFPTGVFNTASENFWLSNYAILSVMTNYHIEPLTSWVLPQQSSDVIPRRMAIFFCPGTPVVGSGYIVLAFPLMFTSASPATVAWGDLDDYIYKTREPTDRVIQRVPTKSSLGIFDSVPQFAFLPFNGSLVATDTYAFYVEVLPVFPVPLAAIGPPYSTRSVWHIRTMYSTWGVLAAGENPRLLPLFEGVFEQPKMYYSQIPLQVVFDSLVPSSVSGSPTLVTLSFELQSPLNDPTPVRLSGPSGFSIDKANCITVLTGPWTTPTCPQAANNALPANILVIDAHPSFAATTYSIQTLVQVPNRSPTMTLNKWRIEFAYDTSISFYGSVIAESDDLHNDARIPGLINGSVVPSSIVAGETHYLRIALETISAVPSTGAIALNVPSAIASIVTPCNAYLKSGLTTTTTTSTPCSISLSSSTTVLFPGPWSPGYRTMYLQVTNVITPTFVASVSGNAPCYNTYCFTFSSLSDVSDLTSYIDTPLVVASYSVLKQIPRGGFAPLTNSLVQQFVGVNNRPLNRNNFVLFFSVLPNGSGEPVASPPFIRIRAPPGFEFDANCTGTIGLVPSQVFSDIMPWPPQYVEVTSTTYVTECIGANNIATIYLSLALSPISGSSLSYALRAGVAKNPSSLIAIDSQWYIQIGSNQATSPFASFALSIMDPIISQITPSNVGYRVDQSAPIQSQLNPVTIVLKPTTTVASSGTIVINTPANTGYRFDPGWSCLYLKFSDTVSTWNQASILCQVPTDQMSLSLTIPNGKAFTADVTYTIETAVFNPTSAADDGPAPWVVGTFMNNIPLDSSDLEGFVLTQPIANISVDPNGVFGGSELIPSLTIRIQARTSITASTVVHIQAPPGFDFFTNTIGSVESTGGCFGLVTTLTVGTVVSSSTATLVQCNHDGSIDVTLPSMTNGNILTIVLEATNPPITPPYPNFWYFSSSGTVFGGESGWTVLPQLEDVSLTLDGPNYATNAYSHLTLKFSTVQKCNMIRFVFPIGFDLSAGVFKVTQIINGLSVTNLITKSQVDDVTQPNSGVLTLLNPINGDQVPVIVEMDNVKLGNVPGPVTVDIATYLDETPVDQYANLIAFTLAGEIRVVDKLLSSPYRENALLVEPKNSNLIPYLTARTGEIGIVHLSLFFASPVFDKERFFVGSYWYNFSESNRSLITFVDSFTKSDLGVSQIMLMNNSMMFTVNSFIPMGAVSLLSFPVRVPILSSEAVSNFLVRSFAPGSPGYIQTDIASYPFHSNDNVTTGFAVSSPLSFTLSTVRSPPSALINMTLNVLDAGYRRIFSFELVSPSGYYFPSFGSCRTGGLFSCTIYNSYYANNRSSIILKTDESGDGITQAMFPIFDIQIGIITPSEQPTVGNWYLIGRGLDDVQVSWGLIADPFVVRPVRFFSIYYSNLLGTRTPLAVSFEVTERIPAGGAIRLYYPNLLTIDCTTFSKLTLPFYDEAIKTVCQVNTDPIGLMNNSTIKIPSRSFNIFLTRDLVPGNFTFTIDILTPLQVIAAPKFSLAIVGPSENIVYASILNVTGDPPFDGSQIGGLAVSNNTNSRLLWYPSPAKSDTISKVGISVISNQIIEAGKVSAFMIYYPEGFLNAISIPSELIVTNSTPLTVTAIDYSEESFLVVYLDPDQQITPGQFTFTFPVYVPPQVPAKNLWFLCVCDEASCTNPFDEGVLTYFPIAGFAIGQTNPLTVT